MVIGSDRTTGHRRRVHHPSLPAVAASENLQQLWTTFRGMFRRAATAFRVDFSPSHRMPALSRGIVATVLAVAGSLIADALLVWVGTALFPATRGYEHFQFADYAQLTIIGVLIACIAWPITTRISTSPRWLFTRMAYAVTLVLLLPDVWLLIQRQPGRAVGVLIVMHLAIAVVTYLALTRLAPERRDMALNRPLSDPSRVQSIQRPTSPVDNEPISSIRP